MSKEVPRAPAVAVNKADVEMAAYCLGKLYAYALGHAPNCGQDKEHLDSCRDWIIATIHTANNLLGN